MAVNDPSRSILVADDDPDILEFVCVALRAAGFHPEPVEGGRQALAAAELEKRKMLVLDVRMPEVSGLDVCRAVKAREDGSSSILLMSADASTEDVAAGYAAGADDYLPKPFSPRELVARVRKLLER